MTERGAGFVALAAALTASFLFLTALLLLPSYGAVRPVEGIADPVKTEDRPPFCKLCGYWLWLHYLPPDWQPEELSSQGSPKVDVN